MEIQPGSQIMAQQQNWLHFHSRLTVDGICMLWILWMLGTENWFRQDCKPFWSWHYHSVWWCFLVKDSVNVIDTLPQYWGPIVGQTPAMSEYCLSAIHDEELFVHFLTLISVSYPSEPWSQNTLFIFWVERAVKARPVASFLSLNFMCKICILNF